MKAQHVRTPVDENALGRDHTFDGHVRVFVVPTRRKITCAQATKS